MSAFDFLLPKKNVGYQKTSNTKIAFNLKKLVTGQETVLALTADSVVSKKDTKESDC